MDNSAELETSDVVDITVEEAQKKIDIEASACKLLPDEHTSDSFYDDQKSQDHVELEEAQGVATAEGEGDIEKNDKNIEESIKTEKEMQLTTATEEKNDVSSDRGNSVKQDIKKKEEALINSSGMWNVEGSFEAQEERQLPAEENKDDVSSHNSDNLLNFEDDQAIGCTPDNLNLSFPENLVKGDEESYKEIEKVIENGNGEIENREESGVNNLNQVNEDNQIIIESQEPRVMAPSSSFSKEEINQETLVEQEALKQEEKEINLEEMSIALKAVTDQEQQSTPTAVGTPKKSAPIEEPHLHHIKTIQFKDKKPLAIVTQNENGPCPLVAIINVTRYFSLF